MPQPLRFALFFGVVLLVLGGLHYYLYARLVRDTGLLPPWRMRATIALIAMGLVAVATMASARALPPSVARIVTWPGYLWFGVMFLLFVALVLGDLVRFAFVQLARFGVGTDDPARRLFLGRVVGGTAVAIATGGAALGVRAARGAPVVRTHEVELAGLPQALDGTKIVHLTDLHIGPTIGRDFIADLVRRTNALEPDLIAITGDLADGDAERLKDDVAPLAELRARRGVYFVPGNHDYYSGIGPWLERVRSLGIRVLVNERVEIREGDAAFDLVGIDDATGRPDLDHALAGRDPARASVLLAHRPSVVEQAAARGIGLQLSGHTHGGQIWPWRLAIFLREPYADGMHLHRDKTWIFVSRGCGYWGPPMRVGAPPEIGQLVLRTPRSA